MRLSGAGHKPYGLAQVWNSGHMAVSNRRARAYASSVATASYVLRVDGAVGTGMAESGCAGIQGGALRGGRGGFRARGGIESGERDRPLISRDGPHGAIRSGERGARDGGARRPGRGRVPTGPRHRAGEPDGAELDRIARAEPEAVCGGAVVVPAAGGGESAGSERVLLDRVLDLVRVVSGVQQRTGAARDAAG